MVKIDRLLRTKTETKMNKGWKFLKKLWCCVGGGNKVIWLYQLSWKCKLATVTSYKVDVSSVRANETKMAGYWQSFLCLWTEKEWILCWSTMFGFFRREEGKVRFISYYSIISWVFFYLHLKAILFVAKLTQYDWAVTYSPVPIRL